MKKLNTREICLMGIFTAFMAVMAQISIPMPLGVPMTMQTFAISLAGVMLGAKGGFFSALAYVLLGAAGVPVFANFTGGMGIILGPTGGFIISFPLLALIIGWGADKGRNEMIAGLIAGNIVNYIIGMICFTLSTGKGLDVAFTACVLPFIPTAIVKAVAAGAVGLKIRARVMSAA
ncbi:MAG: biotin transporter BioY [Synergistaceae bacterium]|nr:biotin transporter BioY [Synergistaceae bacterium]